MKNTGKIIAIVALLILAFLLTLLFIGGIYFYQKGGFDVVRTENIRKTESYAVTGVEQLNLKFTGSDIAIHLADSEEVKVVQYSQGKLKEKHLFHTEQTNGKLAITEGRLRFGFQFFSFGLLGSHYEVFIPKDYQGSISIETTSSDIDMLDSLKLNQFKIKNTSGDVTLTHVNASEVSFQTVSGNIRVDVLRSDVISLKTMSGDIRIAQLEGDSTLKTVSGGIRIEEAVGSVVGNTTSGNIRFEKFLMDESSSFKTVSGNISLMMAEGSTYVVGSDTVSGSVRVDPEVMGTDTTKRLALKTVSGNIKVNRAS